MMGKRVGDWMLVVALSVAQLVSWGSIYYSFSLFVVPMERDLAWSRTALNGALSLGLLVSGLGAYPVGAWIDRHGGRWLMSLGTAAGIALLVAWSEVASEAAFYAIWIGLGLVLSATLYEPAFAVLARRYPEDAPTRITVLTLIGGLASTAFIPLTQLFIDLLGWRHALVGLALCNLAVALPIHALMLRDVGAQRQRPPGPGGEGSVHRALRHKAFWGLALSFTGYYATFTALTFHLVPLLTGRGVATATMLGAIALIGPCQVLGRIALLALGRRASAALSGKLALVAFPTSVALLAASQSAVALFAFAAIYGAANGILTIVRGTAVPELMWRDGYGAVNGALTLPSYVARGAAPYGAALLWSLSGGYQAVLYAAIAGGAIAAAGFWYACGHAEC